MSVTELGISTAQKDFSSGSRIRTSRLRGDFIKLDERPAFRLSEYRLPTGQTSNFHQLELHALPGITHNLIDDDGPIWLSLKRFKRGEPPAPPELITPWLDHYKTPKLRATTLLFRKVGNNVGR